MEGWPAAEVTPVQTGAGGESFGRTGYDLDLEQAKQNVHVHYCSDSIKIH